MEKWSKYVKKNFAGVLRDILSSPTPNTVSQMLQKIRHPYIQVGSEVEARKTAL